MRVVNQSKAVANEQSNLFVFTIASNGFPYGDQMGYTVPNGQTMYVRVLPGLFMHAHLPVWTASSSTFNAHDTR